MISIEHDISYKELQLAFLEGEVDLSGLKIFKEHYLFIPDLKLHIHAGIIGTSHFVQFQSAKGLKFTEILACNANETRSNNTLFLSSIEKLEKSTQLKNNVGDYSFNYSLESYSTVASSISNWNSIQKTSGNLFHLDFYFNLSDLNLPSSRTIISAKRKERSIMMNTVHEYQEENTTVLTKSKLTL